MGCRDDPRLSWVPSPVLLEGFGVGMDLLACTVSSGFGQDSPLGNSWPEGLESSLVPSVTPEPLFEGWQQLLGLKHCAICCVTPGQAVPALYSLVTHWRMIPFPVTPCLQQLWEQRGLHWVVPSHRVPRESPWPFPSRRDGVDLGRQE